MKTMIKIDGRKLWYELERVHYLSDLGMDNMIIVKHPETHELCKARVVMKSDKGIDVVEDFRSDAPYRWFIRKGSLFTHVFLITKQYYGRK